MRQTKDGELEYIQEKLVTSLSDKSGTDNRLDNLWEDMDEDEFDKIEPEGTGLTVPLVSGDVAAIKQLSINDTEEKLGLKVQQEVCCSRHIVELKDKVE